MKTKDMARSWSWDKKKQQKTPRLQFAQPRRQASSYQQRTPVCWSWRLTVGFGNFENESFERRRLRKVELFHDGKTFNS